MQVSFNQITDGVVESITALRKEEDGRLNLVPVQSDQEPLNIMLILAVLESAVLSDNDSSIRDGRLSVGEHTDYLVMPQDSSALALPPPILAAQLRRQQFLGQLQHPPFCEFLLLKTRSWDPGQDPLQPRVRYSDSSILRKAMEGRLHLEGE